MILHIFWENFIEALSEKLAIMIIQPLEITVHFWTKNIQSTFNKINAFMNLPITMLKQHER